MKWFVHIDCDAFFCSVEETINHNLKNKPFAVGGSDNRGAIASANYIARKYGIKSGMSTKEAKRLCKDIIVVSPSKNVYKEVSNTIFSTIKDYMGVKIEKVSIDECYFEYNGDDVYEKCMLLKQTIKNKTNITVTAGISYNKLLAKICSGYDKPDGCLLINKEDKDDFMDKLDISVIPGIGKATTKILNNNNIFTISDAKSLSYHDVVKLVGKHRAINFIMKINGEDNRSIVTKKKKQKSVNTSKTSKKDIVCDAEMFIFLESLCSKAISRCYDIGVTPKSFTVKIRFNDFSEITRSSTNIGYYNSDVLLNDVIKIIKREPLKKPVRMVSIKLFNFINHKFFDKSIIVGEEY